MRSPRYTILIANRKTGSVRRLTVARRVLLALGIVLAGLPILIGLGAQGSDQGELNALRMANEALRLENDSYREATGQLTEQIVSLQTALTDLSEQALDPATKAAIDRLPAVIRSRAAGGVKVEPPAAVPVPKTPETTFGILRDLLGALENRLTSVRSKMEGQQALAQATPRIFPVFGWFSSQFGNRKDPFTGEPDFHPGLDISAERGTPVVAPADGQVEQAGYNGNYGNSILLVHGFGIATRYGHLSRYAVLPGQTVHRGQVIGYVGSTGRATSSHLHYEVLLNGRPTNPIPFLVKP
jgi:murein DD-endopeptidase MepM/ murein hydrolase activator NlpD